ncbi:MAG: hypothetical protein HRK26_02265 [Rickettsiaceae bacterium H1]|nr:hypothetical protein [Rickettsiaceae bacterium H1]
MNGNRNYVTKSIFQNSKLQEAVKYLIDNRVSNPIKYIYDAVNINQSYSRYTCHDFKNPIIKKILEIFGTKVMEDFNDRIFLRILTVRCSYPCENMENLRYALMHLGSAKGYNCASIPLYASDSEVLQLLFDKALNFCSVNEEHTRACLHGYIDDKISTCLQEMFIEYGKGKLTDVDCETLSIQSEFWKTESAFAFTQDYFKTTVVSSLRDVVRNVTDSVLNSSVNLAHEFTTGDTCSGGNDKDDNEKNFGLGTVVALAVSTAAIGFVCGLLLRRLYGKYMASRPSTAIDHPEEEGLTTERVTELELSEL